MADLNRIGGQHYEIMRRCYNEDHKTYKDYGAKGIRVCEEWHNRDVFKAWAYANGYIKGMRVLRYDTKGDYCPENCYIGESAYTTIIKGRNKMQHERAKANRARKAELGVKKLEDHPLYSVWWGMKHRCYNQNTWNYKYYGERGIKICDEWLGDDGFYNFVKWAELQGIYEKGMTIDRIDSDGDYSPDNCRWVTMTYQGRNKKRVHQFLINGELHSAMSYCKMFGYPYGKFLKLLNDGVPISRILDVIDK